MRAFPILAATLLLSWTPALAAESSGVATESGVGHASPAQGAPSQDRRDIMNDIMTKMLMEEQAGANPFKNPGPTMISDGWAQRT